MKQRIMIIVCLVLVAGMSAADESDTKNKQRRANRGGAREAVKKRVETTGVLPGQTVPAIRVHRLDGESAPLAEAWKDKPALIVTASITCPIAKRSCPSMALKEHDFGADVNPVILYTVEAHPRDGRSPYAPFKGKRSRFEYDQPDTLAERLKLANIFAKALEDVSFLVDKMDNEGWTKLGGGPNMAVLIDTDGKVIAKQGWFDAEAMAAEIKKWRAGKRKDTKDQSGGQ